MKRSEFMSRLNDLLADMQEAEREEALQYYNDYLDDAGEENEESAIEGLGSPESVASSIKNAASGENGEFTEKGFSDGSTVSGNELSNRVNYDGYKESENTGSTKKEKRKLSGAEIALIVIGCILLSPFIISGLCVAFAVVVSVIAVVFSIAVAFIAVVISLLVAAVFVFVTGVGMCFSAAPLVGGCLIGASLIILSVFLLVLWLLVGIICVVIPGLFRLIRKLFRKIFRKGGEA